MLYNLGWLFLPFLLIFVQHPWLSHIAGSYRAWHPCCSARARLIGIPVHVTHQSAWCSWGSSLISSSQLYESHLLTEELLWYIKHFRWNTGSLIACQLPADSLWWILFPSHLIITVLLHHASQWRFTRIINSSDSKLKLYINSVHTYYILFWTSTSKGPSVYVWQTHWYVAL